MISETHKQELINIQLSSFFHHAELRLFNFIIEKGRLPNYITEKKEYQTLTRLNKKFRNAKEKLLILQTLFKTIDNIKVSNKLIREGVN